MKKKIFLILTLLTALLLITACGKESTKYYTVSFNSNGAEEFQTRAIAENALIVEPRVPTRVGYSFLGWFYGETKWNFDTDTVNEHMTLTAKWSRIKYIVKFDSNGGSPVEEQTVESGNYAIQPKEPTKENQRFIGWYNGNEQWFFNTNRVTNFVTLTAKWEDYPTYTVEFNSDGGTTVAPQYKIEGTTADIPTAPTKQNSKFLGWYYGDELWDFDRKITSNITLTAKWEAIPTFTVSFNSSGGSDVPSQHVTVGGQVQEPPKPATTQRAELLGWYLDDTKWDFSNPITSDITLVARWKYIYEITFISDGISYSISLDEGNKIPKQPDPDSKPNYRFVGWYYNGVAWNFDSDLPSSDVTLVAEWEKIPTYTVTFDSNGGSSIEPQYVLEGALMIDPGISSRPGYRLDGWYLNGKLWDFGSSKVTKNITLKAEWIEVVTVTFDSTGGTHVRDAIIDKNTKVTEPTAPTRTGYLFLGWLLPDGTAYDFSKAVSENVTLKADWITAYTVTYDTGGSADIAPVIVATGNYAPKPQLKKDKYTAEWYIRGTGTRWNFNSMTVTEDIVLELKWVLTLPPFLP